ncbi:MAG: DUF480 domain-containing protein, partial [Acidimicrobiales bacterium]|nr:DUF480 domain-containing protein [Acidimicrobiales bacterium]
MVGGVGRDPLGRPPAPERAVGSAIVDTALPGDQSEEGRDSQAEPGSEEGEAGLAPLRPEELRVLGCLIEKEATTPDQYPLTMN